MTAIDRTSSHWPLAGVLALALGCIGCGGSSADTEFDITLNDAVVDFELALKQGTVNNDQVDLFFSEANGDLQSVVALHLPCGLQPGSHSIDGTSVYVAVNAVVTFNDKINLGAQGEAAARTESMSGTITLDSLGCECGQEIRGTLDATLTGYRSSTGGDLNTVRIGGKFKVDTSILTYPFGATCD